MTTNQFSSKGSGIKLECHESQKSVNFRSRCSKFLTPWRLKAFILIVLGFISTTIALAQTPEAVVKRTTMSPVIDGIVDAVWATANEYNIATPYRSEIPSLGLVGQTTWKALWNDKGIFILVKVADNVFSPAYDKEEPWMYDKVELYIDCNYDKKDGKGPRGSQNGHYCIAPAPVKGQVNGQINNLYLDGGSFSYMVIGSAYLVEYFIPFSKLVDKEGLAVDITQPIGFDVVIVDNDIQTPSRNRMVWANKGIIDENWNNMDDAGLIVLEPSSIIPLITIDKITLTSGSITSRNGTFQMLPVLEPEWASNKNIQWTVINGTGKAAISPGGLVTALSNGTVTIKATAINQPIVEATTTVKISGQVIDETDLWNNYNLIKNWNFNTDLTDWGGWIDGNITGQTAPVVANGIVSMTSGLANVGEYWHYQLNQAGLKAEPNIPYILKFKSWSSINKSNSVDFEDTPQYTYNRYGATTDVESISGRSEWVYNTTPEPKWFTFHVTFDQIESSTQQKIQWNLSSIKATTYLDSVLLMKADTSSADIPELLLSTIMVSLAAGEANNSFNITSNTNWQVQSDQIWLTVSPPTGTGDQTVLVSAKANPLYSTRTAILTVNASGLIPQTILVTQYAKQDLPTNPGDSTYGENWNNEVWNNYNLIKNWNFNTDLTKWDYYLDGVEQIMPIVTNGFVALTSHLSTDGFNWHYQLMQRGLKAKANVPYILKFKSWSNIPRSNALVFEDNPQNNYNRYGASSDPESVNGRAEWTYNTSAKPRWFTFHMVFDQMVPTTEQKIQWMLSTANATSYLDSIILINGTDSSYVNTQYLTLSKTQVTLEEKEASTTVSIASNTEWEVRSDQTWLSFNPSNGTGDNTITFTAADNPMFTSRKATITVFATSLAAQTITFIQKANQEIPIDSGDSIVEIWNNQAWNSFNLIKNWNFTTDLTMWNYYLDGANQLVPKVTNGYVTLTSDLSDDGFDWHYQLMQRELEAEANVPYILKFKSWSNIPRSNGLVFEDNNPQNNYNRYGASTQPESINGRAEWIYFTNIEPRWFTFHVVFDQMVSNTEQKIQWMLSTADATTYLDSIILIKEADLLLLKNVDLVLSSNHVNLGAASANATVKVSSNTNSMAVSDKSWLTVSPMNVSGTQTLTVATEANLSNTNRTATVTVYPAGLESKTITVTQESTTGIDPILSDQKLTIFPNPTIGKVKLVLNQIPDKGSYVIVNDVTGKTILRKPLLSKEEWIDLQGNTPGVYFIKTNLKELKVQKVLLK